MTSSLQSSGSQFGRGCVVAIHFINTEIALGTKRSGKGRRKLGRKKRRMRAKIRHRKK